MNWKAWRINSVKISKKKAPLILRENIYELSKINCYSEDFKLNLQTRTGGIVRANIRRFLATGNKM